MDFTVCLINNSSATESAACPSAENYDDLESIESSFSLADFCTPQQNTSFNQIHCLEEPFSTNQNDPLKCFYGDGFTPFSLAEAMCAHQQQKNQLFYGGQNGKHQNWTTNCCRFLPIVQKELVVYEPEEAEVTMPLPAAESEEAPELLSPCSYYSKHSTNSPSMIQTTSASGSGQDNTPEIIDEELLAKQIWKNEQMIQMMSPFQKYRDMVIRNHKRLNQRNVRRKFSLMNSALPKNSKSRKSQVEDITKIVLKKMNSKPTRRWQSEILQHMHIKKPCS